MQKSIWITFFQQKVYSNFLLDTLGRHERYLLILDLPELNSTTLYRLMDLLHVNSDDAEDGHWQNWQLSLSQWV